jgi:hypothetical protein
MQVLVLVVVVTLPVLLLVLLVGSYVRCGQAARLRARRAR